MSTQIGTGHIHSLTGGALGCAALAGYVSPNLTTLRLSHAAEVDNIKGQTGKTTGSISEDDTLECTFDFLPEGTTIANAKLSAGLPAANSGFTITGLPIIACGGFTDALNTNAGNTQPWIYQGGGTINGPADGKWTATLPMKRFLQITSATAIT